MPIRHFFSAICFALLLALLPSDLVAQRQLGIRWEVPDDVERANRELEIFRELGITHLEVNHKLSASVWTKINELGFRTFGALPIRFPLAHTFSEPDSTFLEMIRSLVTHYSNQKSVQAIGFFQYGPVRDDWFIKTLTPYVQQMREIYSGELYYLTRQSDTSATDRLFDFKMISLKPDNGIQIQPDSKKTTYYYNPSDRLESYLTPVKRFLEKTSSVSAPVFFSSQWMFETLEVHPEFQQTIRLYATNSKPVFAVPEESAHTTSSHSLIVLLLIFTWGCFAVNYSLSPVFRRSMFRYFIGHKFYVEDIMQRHIRSMAPAGVMLLLHALLAGVAAYCYISATFSALAVEALTFHLPVSILGGNFMVSVVVGACLVTLVIEAVCLLWLFLSNQRIRKLSQAVNLYAWPVQLNLFIATGMVALLMAGFRSTLISVLAGLFILIFLSGFIVTSFDTIRYVKNKYLYLTGTSIIYSAFWIALLIWALNNAFLMDVYRLALWLS